MSEKQYLEENGICYDPENKRGKYRFTAESNSNSGCTLYFMPHCPYRLYCNILWENWDILDNILILGNRYCKLLTIH